MGKLSRVKGRAFEQVTARKLRPLFGERVKRGYQRRDGREAPDVEGTPFWIECKHGKCVNVRAAMAQAVAATDGRAVVVIAKDDGTRAALAVMWLDDWLELVGRELPRLVVTGLEAFNGQASGSEEAASGAEEAGEDDAEEGP